MLLLKKLETMLICIILIIVGLLIFLYTQNKIENFSKSKIKINYLSAKEAAKVFLNSEKFPQIKKFRLNEIYARTTYYGSSSNINNMRNIAKKIYTKNTINFTEVDKFKINNNLNSLNKRIIDFNNKNNTNIPVMKTWNLIKISSNMDWGFPYTINNYIVISDDFITNTTTKQMLSTLFHEQFHIYQRKYPMIFKKLYSQWNFKYIKNFKLPSKIDDYIITNPDAPNNDYIFKLNKNNYLLPILILDKNNNDNHLSKCIYLKKNKNSFEIKSSKLINLKDIPNYYTRFYKIDQNYHPNEIFANLMSKIVFQKLKLNNNDHKLIKKFFDINLQIFNKV